MPSNAFTGHLRELLRDAVELDNAHAQLRSDDRPPSDRSMFPSALEQYLGRRVIAGDRSRRDPPRKPHGDRVDRAVRTVASPIDLEAGNERNYCGSVSSSTAT